MKRTLSLALGFFLLLLAGASDLAWHYPQLPEQVVTKFNPAGRPQHRQSRRALLTAQCIGLALPAVLIAGAWVLVRVLPPSLINVPHREFWLAPGRIDHTRAVMGDLMLMIGVVTTGFLVLLQHLTLRANLRPDPRLGEGLWVAVALQLLGLGAVVVWVFRRFRRPT